jgi:hypothetical protein
MGPGHGGAQTQDIDSGTTMQSRLFFGQTWWAWPERRYHIDSLLLGVRVSGENHSGENQVSALFCA